MNRIYLIAAATLGVASLLYGGYTVLNQLDPLPSDNSTITSSDYNVTSFCPFPVYSAGVSVRKNCLFGDVPEKYVTFLVDISDKMAYRFYDDSGKSIT
jgi:hypothetical protein